MKNDLHLAYKTVFNHPLHISSPDSVRAHLADKVRLIAQIPGEWPKVRGRFLTDPKNYTVENTFKIRDMEGKSIVVFTGDNSARGKLVDGKYFFSDGILNNSPDLELMFTPFEELGAIPMARRWWSPDYLGSFPYYFALVEEGTTEHFDSEPYIHIEGYKELGINHLADLMAYSYKFQWDRERSVWYALTDEHAITKRIRKPWMHHLVQVRYGESPATEADLAKLVSFLLTKVDLTKEETEAVSEIRGRVVTLDDLRRLNERHADLNKILAAYNDPMLLVPGANVDDDPLFAIDYI
ncbi:hypothetical protein LCF88_004499 [Salmonella enterica]|uniref:hypothetical protein n=1 Tax=Salmonella enterica TaxID=28901 RepID=UPI0010FB6E6F|nr:hypothetical protein [Salmonella enterica]EBZ7571637.1 hypothetical protein [Salmonella enterica subsp. enterica serovar Infantis]HCJ9458836.1 hypothetical protein [Escherichia coli]EBO6938128.1 hypothetical protein [Salmonella enterica]EID8267592.1 hypothetical protein [Salmonella enterica]EJW0444496.1 hypothetical protein [Salmonella enterica]